MNLLDMINPYRWLIMLALVAAVIGGAGLWLHNDRTEHEKIGQERATRDYNQKIETQKAEAAKLLTAETAKAAAATQALADFKNQQELKDEAGRQKIAALDKRLLQLAPNGRLRDPHANEGCRCSGPAPEAESIASTSDRPDDRAQAGGLLSAELSGLLFRLVDESDTINLAYASCRADAQELRLLLSAP